MGGRAVFLRFVAICMAESSLPFITRKMENPRDTVLFACESLQSSPDNQTIATLLEAYQTLSSRRQLLLADMVFKELERVYHPDFDRWTQIILDLQLDNVHYYRLLSKLVLLSPTNLDLSSCNLSFILNNSSIGSEKIGLLLSTFASHVPTPISRVWLFNQVIPHLFHSDLTESILLNQFRLLDYLLAHLLHKSIALDPALDQFVEVFLSAIVSGPSRITAKAGFLTFKRFFDVFDDESKYHIIAKMLTQHPAASISCAALNLLKDAILSCDAHDELQWFSSEPLKHTFVPLLFKLSSNVYSNQFMFPGKSIMTCVQVFLDRFDVVMHSLNLYLLLIIRFKKQWSFDFFELIDMEFIEPLNKTLMFVDEQLADESSFCIEYRKDYDDSVVSVSKLEYWPTAAK